MRMVWWELLQHQYEYTKMTVTLTKSGPFYASGAISFSSLRTNFKATDIDGTVSDNTSPISASQLRRIDSKSDADPTVPDATENTGISTGNNLSISQFRNSVKYYKVSQTDTNTNLNISTQAWNTNLSKNIKKKVSIAGTIGSSDTNIPALLTTYEQHCNLEIAVTGTGKVIGAGGTAGTANGGNGGNGGTAMDLLNSLAASVIKITVVSGANIYGGGGGGGAGNKGANGSPGTGGSYQQATYASECGTFNTNCTDTALDATTRNTFCGYVNLYCPSYSTVNTNGGTAGTGGTGGNGGVGAGYSQTATNAPALGAAGGPVTAPALGAAGGPTSGGGGTATAGTSGSTGTTGGNGGNYGVDGTAANPGGNGGTAGRAIAGSHYSVTGTIIDETVKGLYNL